MTGIKYFQLRQLCSPFLKLSNITRSDHEIRHFHKMKILKAAALKVKKCKENGKKMAANAERAPALQQGQPLRRGSCFEQQEPEDSSTRSLSSRYQMLREPDRTSSVPFVEPAMAAVVTELFTLMHHVVTKLKKFRLNFTLSLAPTLES